MSRTYHFGSEIPDLAEIFASNVIIQCVVETTYSFEFDELSTGWDPEKVAYYPIWRPMSHGDKLVSRIFVSFDGMDFKEVSEDSLNQSGMLDSQELLKDYKKLLYQN